MFLPLPSWEQAASPAYTGGLWQSCGSTIVSLISVWRIILQIDNLPSCDSYPCGVLVWALTSSTTAMQQVLLALVWQSEIKEGFVLTLVCKFFSAFHGFDWQLIFFIEAHMMLYFGFLMKIVVITHWCLVTAEQFLHEVSGISSPRAALPVRSCGCMWVWEGTASVQLTQAGHRDIPNHMASSSARTVGIMKKGRWSEYWCLFSRETAMHCEHCFLGGDWTSASQWEAVNEFLVLICLCAQLLFYLVNYLYLNPQVLPLLPFWFSSPSSCGAAVVWLCGAEIPAGLNHSTTPLMGELLLLIKCQKRGNVLRKEEMEKERGKRLPKHLLKPTKTVFLHLKIRFHWKQWWVTLIASATW